MAVDMMSDLIKMMQDALWRDISTAPHDREIMLYYEDYCNAGPLIVSGHWDEQEGREHEATFRHSFGHGDGDMWRELPAGPPHKPPADPSI